MHGLPVYIALLHAYVAVLECVHGFEKQSAAHITAGILMILLAFGGLASHRSG